MYAILSLRSRNANFVINKNLSFCNKNWPQKLTYVRSMLSTKKIHRNYKYNINPCYFLQLHIYIVYLQTKEVQYIVFLLKGFLMIWKTYNNTSCFNRSNYEYLQFYEVNYTVGSYGTAMVQFTYFLNMSGQ